MTIGLLASAVAAAGWLFTAAPGPAWGDVGEFHGVARSLGVTHPPGYPLYSLLAALAYRLGGPWFLNALSGLFAAAAIGLTAAFLASRGRPLPALVTAAAAATAPLLWSQAQIAEVYTLHLLLSAALLLLLLWTEPNPRWGYTAAALFGLGLVHHPLILALLPVAVALVIRHRPVAGHGRYAVGLLLALAVPLLAWVYLPIASRAQPAFDWGNPEDGRAWLYHVTCRQYAALTGPRPVGFVWRVLLAMLARTPAEVTWPLLLLTPLGLAEVYRRRRDGILVLVSLALLFLLGSATAATANLPYFIVPWWLLAVLGGLGLQRLVIRHGRLGGIAAMLVIVAVALRFPLPSHRGDDLPRRYARTILDSLPPDAVLFTYSDSLSNLSQSLRLLDEVRPDLDLINVGDLIAVDSDAFLARSYPRLVLPPGGYHFDSWPLGHRDGLRIEHRDDLVRALIAHQLQRRPVFFEYGPGLEGALPASVPYGHLFQVIGMPIEHPDAAALARHEALAARLMGLTGDEPPADPGARLAYVLAENGLGWYWSALNDPVRAEAAFRRALEYEPEDAATLGNLAILLAEQGRTAAAAEALAEARRLAPWDAALARNESLLAEQRR